MKIGLNTRESLAWKRSRGFTLAEPAIGISILLLLIIAFYSGIAHCIHITRMSRENQRATQILLQKSEVVRMYKWQQITNGFIPRAFTNVYNPGGGAERGVIFIGSIGITNAPVSAPYSTNLKAVTIGLRWTSGGMPRQREMRTLISQWGLNNYVD